VLHQFKDSPCGFQSDYRKSICRLSKVNFFEIGFGRAPSSLRLVGLTTNKTTELRVGLSGLALCFLQQELKQDQQRCSVSCFCCRWNKLVYPSIPHAILQSIPHIFSEFGEGLTLELEARFILRKGALLLPLRESNLLS